MSVEIEEMLLGAVLDAEGGSLKSNAGQLLDLAGLKPEDFSNADVCIGWRLASKLVGLRRPVDAEIVIANGIAMRVLPAAAQTRFRELASRNTLNKTSFVEVVEQLRKVRQRETLKKHLEAALAALPDSEPAKVAGTLESACSEISMASQPTDQTADGDVLELGSEWEARDANGSVLLVPTGIAALDKAMGGWAPNLNIVAGLPSVGKSALLASVIEAQLKLGLKVGLVGLEDGTRWLAKRLLAKGLGIPVRDVGTKKIDSLPRETQERYGDVFQSTMSLLKNLIIYQRDSITPDALIRLTANWVQNRGVQVVYVDHGGEIEHDTKTHNDYRLAVGDTYRRIRNFALRYQVPMVVLAHTNRASERDDGEERPPKASDLAESAYIERRARVMIGLWRRYGEPHHMRCTIMKATEGDWGQTLKLDRLTTSALIDPDAGEQISLAAERMAEARARKEAKEADRAASKAEKAAAKPSKTKSQMTFGGDA